MRSEGKQGGGRCRGRVCVLCMWGEIGDEGGDREAQAGCLRAGG